jgi:UDP-N-acetylglucosamine--N-acetylmuramyl-(pentapeptide) pyrophosphoryl-undecaprenol N-acetylglucosamine transferase
VAEDHQTKNALALSTRDAALLVKDVEAKDVLIKMAISTVKDSDRLSKLGENAGKMAFHNSADIIAEEVCKLASEYMQCN